MSQLASKEVSAERGDAATLEAGAAEWRAGALVNVA